MGVRFTGRSDDGGGHLAGGEDGTDMTQERAIDYGLPRRVKRKAVGK